MKKRASHKLSYLAAGIFVISIVCLMVSEVFEYEVPFVEVKAANALAPQELKNARIFGTVAEEGIEMFPDGRGMRFLLVDSADDTQAMWVEYKGMIPDTFKPGSEVYVEGTKESPDQHFSATNLITKCPSKYQKENRV